MFTFQRSDRGWLGFRYFTQESEWQVIRRLWLGYWWVGLDTHKGGSNG